VWWPAGLQELTPTQRAHALKLGFWPDGDEPYIVTRSGRRLYRPSSARQLRSELAELEQEAVR
jgi:hypothetical protein